MVTGVGNATLYQGNLVKGYLTIPKKPGVRPISIPHPLGWGGRTQFDLGKWNYRAIPKVKTWSYFLTIPKGEELEEDQMKTKMEQFPATNPNPVVSVGKDGRVLYSNAAGEPLLREWGVVVGEKLPSYIGDLVQRVISLNSSEKMEVKAGNRLYVVSFHHLPEEECVNIYGFDISDQKE